MKRHPPILHWGYSEMRGHPLKEATDFAFQNQHELLSRSFFEGNRFGHIMFFLIRLTVSLITVN